VFANGTREPPLVALLETGKGLLKVRKIGKDTVKEHVGTGGNRRYFNAVRHLPRAFRDASGTTFAPSCRTA
jgi:hypothetical protein